MEKEKGWKPIPLSLKILFVVFVLWIFGSVMAISARYELGFPFFGFYVYGMVAGFIILTLDIIAPITFLFALSEQKIMGGTIFAHLRFRFQPQQYSRFFYAEGSIRITANPYSAVCQCYLFYSYL